MSPEAIASSTLRRNVLTRERRDLLTRVRRSILRTIFLAELVLAISSHLNWFRRHCRARYREQGEAYSHRVWARQRRFAKKFRGQIPDPISRLNGDPGQARALFLTGAAIEGRSPGLHQSFDPFPALGTGGAFPVIDLKSMLKIPQGPVGSSEILQTGAARLNRLP